MKLIKRHVRHDIRRHFITHRIVNLWNSLPAHASSVNDFKNELDAHWSNQEMVHNYLDKTTRGHGRRHYSASKSASPMSILR